MTNSKYFIDELEKIQVRIRRSTDLLSFNFAAMIKTDGAVNIMSLPVTHEWAPVEGVEGVQARCIKCCMETDRGVEIAEWICETGSEMTLHYHTSSELIRVNEGVLLVLIDGKVEKLTAGQELYIPPNVPHAGYTLEKATVTTFYEPPIPAEAT